MKKKKHILMITNLLVNNSKNLIKCLKKLVKDVKKLNN